MEFSEDWRAAMNADYERGHVIQRRGKHGRTVDWELVRLPDQFPDSTRALEGEAVTVPPMAASVATLVVAPDTAGKRGSGRMRKGSVDTK